MNKFIIYSLILVLLYGIVEAQIENVPVVHPVYDFLAHMEARGLTGNY